MAVSPRSASQISPGRGFIGQVEDFLFGGARARNIKEIRLIIQNGIERAQLMRELQTTMAELANANSSLKDV